MRAALSKDRARDAAPVFAALGHPTRLALVTRLCVEGPQSIAQLTDETKLTRQAITKHLDALDEAGLARSEREGRERIWQIVPQRLVGASVYLEQISKQWDDAIERLRAFVETDD